MKLKLFIPEWNNEEVKKNRCVPFLYPFCSYEQTYEQRIKNYGEWIDMIELHPSIETCDIVLPAYYVNDYYHNKRTRTLFDINKAANKFGKLTVCWTRGDSGITTPFKNFHLYRSGGYLSKNKGNEFIFPSFFPDPLHKYYDDKLSFHEMKTAKPLIGFCGQGKAGINKWIIDKARNTYRLFLKKINRWPFDIEANISSTADRSFMLDILERSILVDTKFIRHAKYRAGVRNKNERKETNEMYFKNMQESQYMFCYRGAGNFSLRLYETLAAGRIPFIIRSDNNLIFPDKINWHQFPMTDKAQAKNLDKFLSNFHSNLTTEQFIQLQLNARKIWEEFISYKGYMTTFTNKYQQKNFL